jgi:hypothetical protein
MADVRDADVAHGEGRASEAFDGDGDGEVEEVGDGDGDGDGDGNGDGDVDGDGDGDGDDDDDGDGDDGDDDEEEEEPVRKVLPVRTTRQKRTTALVGEAAEADAQFWEQKAFEDASSDDEFTASEGVSRAPFATPRVCVPAVCALWPSVVRRARCCRSIIGLVRHGHRRS